MSALDLLLSPFQRSTYVQKLVTERTEHLRRELQMKDEFIQSWGHDIGAPINGMKAALALLNGVKDKKELVYVLDVITVGCRVLDDIYHNIWEFANGYTNEIHTDNIELAKWLPSVVTLYGPLAKAKDIQILLRDNTDRGFTIVSDKLKLTQIISNLLNNAIMYTPVGKSISIRSYSKNDLLYIEVQDEGEGIPNDKLRDIFQPHVRLHKRGQGMGIGLTICERLTGQLQGSIKVASALSEGSIFTVILPLSLP